MTIPNHKFKYTSGEYYCDHCNVSIDSTDIPPIVVAFRRAGYTFSDIGKRFGFSRQNAQSLFKKYV